MFVSIPPRLSVSKLMQYLKGTTSRRLQMEYQVLRKQYWGQHIWAMGCFCVSSGNETDDMIKNYIQNHDERDDSFSVEGE